MIYRIKHRDLAIHIHRRNSSCHFHPSPSIFIRRSTRLEGDQKDILRERAKLAANQPLTGCFDERDNERRYVVALNSHNEATSGIVKWSHLGVLRIIRPDIMLMIFLAFRQVHGIIALTVKVLIESIRKTILGNRRLVTKWDMPTHSFSKKLLSGELCGKRSANAPNEVTRMTCEVTEVVADSLQ
ncbi:retrovirus-related pol polyprotein from transposon TNT 1-94 [Tanacetum coccineum]